MANPRLLLLDEPSLGLAPLIVREIMGIIKLFNEKEGLTILLVEQNANMALTVAHYCYLLETGLVAVQGDAAQLRLDPSVRRTYLGDTEVAEITVQQR
jgi:branched-chain amino acid transport system ATP-binding protein